MLKKSLLLMAVSIVLMSISINAQQYNLVWEENFDGNSLDMSVWNYDDVTGVWNWGDNKELQSYHPENVTVGPDGEGGNALIITAKRENRVDNYQFTSGRIHTRGKKSFRYGKIEARIKFPNLANGLWPAFWMLGTQKGWPASGEIDILEAGHQEGIRNGTQERTFNGALHWQEGGNYAGYGYQHTAPAGTSIYNYNRYTMIWTPDKIEMFFNDDTRPYYSMAINGADKEEFRDWEHYFILNMAVGGSFPGITNPNNITAPLPAKMYVDYVRVYQIDGEYEPSTPVETDGWEIWNGEGGNSSVSFNDGNFATVDVFNKGTQSWAVQLFKDNISIPNGNYELTFRIKSDLNRQINVNIGKGLDYDPWFSEFMPPAQFNTNSQWQTYTHRFTKTNGDFDLGKIVFELGAVSGNEETKVYIDNIKLRNLDQTSINNSNASKLAVYPNPVKEALTVTSSINETLGLYNLAGVLIKTKKAVSEETVFNTNNLEKGVYFIKTRTAAIKFIKE